jgi:hypothetical protein
VPVPGEADPLQVQYDYLLAYFDFFTGAQDNYKVARKIVTKYEEYPIASWRLLFLAIIDQINEYDGEFDDNEEMEQVENKMLGLDGPDLEMKMEDERKKNKKESKKRDPNITSIELDQTTGALTIESVNIKQIQIKYYIINAEILFSRAPFLKDNAEGFSYVKPFHTIE